MQSRLNRKPQLLRSYQVYLTDGNTASFVAAIAKQYSVGTLVRMSETEDSLYRRASALALGLLGDTSVNDAIGRLIADEDRKVRLIADDAMKAIWSRYGSPKIRHQLDKLTRMLQCNRYEQAIQVADDLLAQGGRAPDVFSQRGLARFFLDDWRGAIEDCHKALEINPYHYVAWIGIGHSYMEFSEPLMALDSFRHALRIYPDIESVRGQIRRLERAFQDPT